MGLLGFPASFQCPMERVLRNISNIIVYIDDLLVHTKSHEDHLIILDHVLECLEHHNLKINLDKCFFGNREVSYLGFTLTPEGIKPGKSKLKAIKDAKHPTDAKTIRSSWDCAIFLEHTSKHLQLLQHPCSNSHARTMVIKVAQC
jgi:hypothetical protein